MRLLTALFIILAFAAAGCGSSKPPQGEKPMPAQPQGSGGGVASSCIAGFVWNGRTYARDAGELEGVFEVGAELGEGVTGCDDTGGALEEPDQAVTVLRIKGVEPEIAVAQLGDDHPYFNVAPAG